MGQRGATVLSGLALLAFAALLHALGARVDPIPDQLPPVDPSVDVAALTLPGQRDLETLRLGDLRGRVVVLFLADQGAVMSLEGSGLRNALARWSLPDDVVGVEVAGMMDLPGFLRGQLEKMMGTIAAEWRFPMYLDYGGTFAEAFRIPKGHVGTVILGRSGEVLLRLAGDATVVERDQIQRLLGASEPPPAPRAPDLTDLAPSLDPSLDHALDEAPGELLLIFLDRPVRTAELMNSGMMAMASALPDPSLRLLHQFAHAFDLRGSTRLIVVGELVGSAPWAAGRVADRSALRTRLSIPEGEAAIVAIDRDGSLVGREHGKVALWKISLIAEAIGATPRVPGR